MAFAEDLADPRKAPRLMKNTLDTYLCQISNSFVTYGEGPHTWPAEENQI